MDNEIAVQEKAHELVKEGVFSSIQNFKEIYDIGKMFASSTLVPQAYQGKPMDCTIAVDMANRMGVSPMMVMQNLYVVKGKPSWSGQACMSLINGSGKFNHIHHVYTGERNTDTRGCYVEAVRIEDGETVRGVEVTMEMAKAEGWTSNKKWQSMPELMLAYRASAYFARVHIPNALMGVSVEGEAEDITKSDRIETTDPFAQQPVINEETLKEAEEIFE
ncbi:hypothetical protein A8806_110130 [Faecalicatena orotica]|jgi:hypothetical protein|uniref:RecT family protein n=1 Tax=Faecalicatena orotica TaxID=1544 RepID=A0A2Y9BHB3_9FIRM|nr:recombinase RecT [Faecalicatena orotica]PWJ27955.1 hypothetical protein A8806_110130 [Faecalicatena orotica]SSA56978.1 hypothetical protein SAMN05216536_110130 [Faecalicatena orotica]DAT88411.1 MAG TPA: RecT protein [Caudoviricetes sp.]